MGFAENLMNSTGRTHNRRVEYRLHHHDTFHLYAEGRGGQQGGVLYIFMTAIRFTKPLAPTDAQAKRVYNLFILLVAGLGGLLYGLDLGIIGGALPYMEATSGLTAAQLSVIVAAVLLGSVISTLFAGVLADWLGRKPLMILSGFTFIVSIPVIALSHGYGPLFLGQLLQGICAGLVGVVIPLYLAECLSASNRGKGTGFFQWLLTLGFVAAAVAGIYFSYRVEAVARAADAATLFAFKDQVWRRIFWASLPLGLLFMVGSLFVSESPRWLLRKGKRELALAALLRSRSAEQANLEMKEMEETAHTAAALRKSRHITGQSIQDSLLRRMYAMPFLMACIILFCTTATGVNSILGYNTAILLQSGLSDLQAHWGYVIFTVVNFVMTMVGIALVDRKGRKFLLVLGTSGIIVSLTAVGVLFLGTEKQSVDCRNQVQAMVGKNQELTLRFDQAEASRLLAAEGYSGKRYRQRSRISRRHLLLRRLHGRNHLCALRRPGVGSPADHARKLRSRQPRGSFFEASICRPECGPDRAAEDQESLDGPGAGCQPRMVGSLLVICIQGVFCAWSRCVRLACPFRVDANAHPVQWDEYRPDHKSVGFNHAGGNFSPLRGQVWIFLHLLSLRRLHGDLFPGGGILAAGDQRHDPGRD